MKTAMILFLLLFALAAQAQVPDPGNSQFPNQICVCPSGDIPVVAYINDIAGNPVPSWPIYMSFSSGVLNYTAGYPGNELVTCVNGIATFHPQVGGCDMSGLVVRYDEWIWAFILGHTNFVNSPDMDASGKVNLVDLSLFATAFYGAYNRCADFNGDGVLNLVDVSIFATHFGH